MFVWLIVRGWNVNRRYLLEGHTPSALGSDVISFGYVNFCAKFSAQRWSFELSRIVGNDKRSRRGGCLFWFMRKESFHGVLCVLYLF